VKLFINNNYEYIKNLRLSGSSGQDQEENIDKQINAESFFSMDLKDPANKKKRKKKEGEGISFLYNFLEGVNSAVKYDMTMNDFFKD
jgi:hypothetical protein